MINISSQCSLKPPLKHVLINCIANSLVFLPRCICQGEIIQRPEEKWHTGNELPGVIRHHETWLSTSLPALGGSCCGSPRLFGGSVGHKENSLSKENTSSQRIWGWKGLREKIALNCYWVWKSLYERNISKSGTWQVFFAEAGTMLWKVRGRWKQAQA